MTDKNPSPTLEERLHKMERLQLKHGTELNVFKRAVWSLIVTHPDPAAFAVQFQEAAERTLAVHLNDELVTDEVRDASHQYAMELVVLARAEHQRRLGESPQAPLA